MNVELSNKYERLKGDVFEKVSACSLQLTWKSSVWLGRDLCVAIADDVQFEQLRQTAKNMQQLFSARCGMRTLNDMDVVIR